MSLAARIVLGICGLLVALYACASLAGVVMPPWWQRNESRVFADGRWWDAPEDESWDHAVPREGREAISIGVGSLGIGLIAVAAFARRAKPEPPPVR